MGDWYEELADELERIDAWENAPQNKPLTDAELTDFCERNKQKWSKKSESGEH